jgi:ligand-binding sensor domain-containing protein
MVCPISESRRSCRIVLVSSGILWVGTRSGLNAFDRRTERFARYLHDPTDPRSLSDNTVLAIYEDQAGVLWLGTSGGLNRFDPASGAFTAYEHDSTESSQFESQHGADDRRG